MTIGLALAAPAAAKGKGKGKVHGQAGVGVKGNVYRSPGEIVLAQARQGMAMRPRGRQVRAGNTHAFKIKKSGGVVKFAKELLKAKNMEERTKAIFKALGYLTGTTAAVIACTP